MLGSLASGLAQSSASQVCRCTGLLVIPIRSSNLCPSEGGAHWPMREPCSAVSSAHWALSRALLRALSDPSHASPTAIRSPPGQVPAPPLPPRVAAGVTGFQTLLPCPPHLTLLAVPHLTLELSEWPEGIAPLPPPFTHVWSVWLQLCAQINPSRLVGAMGRRRGSEAL